MCQTRANTDCTKDTRKLQFKVKFKIKVYPAARQNKRPKDERLELM